MLGNQYIDTHRKQMRDYYSRGTKDLNSKKKPIGHSAASQLGYKALVKSQTLGEALPCIDLVHIRNLIFTMLHYYTEPASLATDLQHLKNVMIYQKMTPRFSPINTIHSCNLNKHAWNSSQKVSPSKIVRNTIRNKTEDETESVSESMFVTLGMYEAR